MGHHLRRAFTYDDDLTLLSTCGSGLAIVVRKYEKYAD